MTTTQDDTVTDEAAPASRRPSRPVVATFVVATALSLAMGAVWAISTPLFASPDEPSHAIRAVATWTGDPSGQVTRNAGIKVKEYRVPSPYDQSQAIAACSAFDATKTADCGPPFDPDGRTLTAMSTAGFYPPLFYWAVGWGGAVFDGSAGLYLMRLIHVALCAVLIGLAAVSTVRRGRRGLPLVGVALAVTPMVMFLAGTVNSSGLEIAASIALWASLLALLGEEEPPRLSRWPDAAIAVCSGLVLVFTRTFSPGYAAVICAVAFAASPGVNLRNIWRRRDALTTFGILAVAAVVATLLIIRSGQFDSPATGGASLPPGETPLSIGLGFQELAFRQMIAYFGWLDTGTAQLSYYSWIIACGTLVVAALVVGRWRRILGLTLAVLATVVLPIAANWGQVKTDGFVWQGRYSLPLAVGIPLIAALACGEAGLPERMARRLVVMLASLAATGQAYAVYWALRRHSVGLDGELVFFGLADWSPPVLGTAGTMAAALAISVALVVALTRAGPALPPPAGLDTTDDPAPSTEAGIP